MSTKKKRGFNVCCLLALLIVCSTYAVAQPTIVVVATGGTIAMKVDAEAGGPVPALRW